MDQHPDGQGQDINQDINRASESAPLPPVPPAPAQNTPFQQPFPSTFQPFAASTGGRSMPLLVPLLLILAGVVFLLENLGYLDSTIWEQLGQLWPLILIAIGLDILLGRRNQIFSALIMLVLVVVGVAILYLNGGFTGEDPLLSMFVLIGVSVLIIGVIFANGGFASRDKLIISDLDVPLGDSQSANVWIDFGAGELVIDEIQGSAWQLATGTLEYDESQGDPERTVTPGPTAGLRLSQHFRGPMAIPTQPLHWNVHLNPQVPLSLTVKTGAGNARLNLMRLRVTDLYLEAGAGSAGVVFPTAAGNMKAVVRGGAVGITLSIPANVEARINVSSGPASINIDGRFKKQNGYYVSDRYGQAPSNLDLDLEVGVSSVNIRTV